MKFVALLSGGKDSCFNIVHCVQNGHQLVAAASLRPPHGIEELDSFMYQTVGQDAVEFVARALGVPLYRRTISGTAINQNSEYGSRHRLQGVTGDETEDLYELLLHVKSFHPDIEAVSAGAILSNYQRVRVEHVCRRLSLIPLCFLWQMNQEQLLASMVDTGLQAVLIKVAGIGLTPKHLGKSLAEMQPTLKTLNEKYGAHICGEGGEYESLTLDCPVFKQSISLGHVDTVIHSDSSFATVAYLRIENASLAPKPETPIPSCSPPLFDRQYEEIYSKVPLGSRGVEPHPPGGSLHPSSKFPPSTSHRVGNYIVVSNIERVTKKPISLADEISECFSILQDKLSSHQVDLSKAVSIVFLVGDMSTFAAANAIYHQYFGTSPPSRATVSIDLPSNVRVRMECVAYDESGESKREALHVQSLSYWAPANIGPYSQAITVDEKIFMSGQIGLIPATLTLPSPSDLIKETTLSFQHVRRVTDALKANSGGGWEGFVQVNFIWLTSATDLDLVQLVHALECEATATVLAPTLFIGVKALPKGALVEKQVILHSGRITVTDEDGDLSVTNQSPLFNQDDQPNGMHLEASVFPAGESAHTALFFNDVEQLTEEPKLTHHSNLMILRLFHAIPISSSLTAHFQELHLPVTPIEARFLADSSSSDRRWNYALYMHK